MSTNNRKTPSDWDIGAIAGTTNPETTNDVLVSICGPPITSDVRIGESVNASAEIVSTSSRSMIS
jgi:hypothetical protein